MPSATAPQTQAIVPIPEPSGLPFFGNITGIDRDFPLGSMIRLADQYGSWPCIVEPNATLQTEDAWKPFGNGMRGCIGRPFAWQESLLVMTMLLQNFNFILQPDYELGIKQTLTIKPKDLTMRAILRESLTPTIPQHRLSRIAIPTKTEPKKAADSLGNGSAGIPLTVVYGSNSETCESLARRVATDAASHGFSVTKIDCMDSINAGHFISWIEGLKKEKQPLRNTSYAVFGCGHKDWTQTSHRIPKLVDNTLADLGAIRVEEIGLADLSNGKVFSDFEEWEDHVLWLELASRYIKSENFDRTLACFRNIGVVLPKVFVTV
ncbi:flavo protein [Pleomassaria siparia CBS 279.74]|uniref:Flavo protein n=1 Tax=Pleomassaria siparia CBS 279.74 TaxID=1314801 RepID=A0A6G1KI38_9PLEO|nr:flavo protein [Pleomassaria siparia CBS 279.74]